MPPVSSFGTLLKRGDGGAPETFTTVAHVMDIEGPDDETDFEEITTHSSAASGNFKEWLPLLQDGVDVTMDLLWDPNEAQHVGIQSDKANRVKRNWQMVFPTTPPATASFAGYVKSFKFKTPVKGTLKRSLAIKVTGPVAIT